MGRDFVIITHNLWARCHARRLTDW